MLRDFRPRNKSPPHKSLRAGGRILGRPRIRPPGRKRPRGRILGRQRIRPPCVCVQKIAPATEDFGTGAIYSIVRKFAPHFNVLIGVHKQKRLVVAYYLVELHVGLMKTMQRNRP